MRTRSIVIAAAAVALMAGPAAVAAPGAERAGTSTVLGNAAAGTGSCSTPGSITIIQSTAAGASFTSPGGIATSFTYPANAVPGQTARLLFFVPGAVAGHWTVVSKSPLMPVTSSVSNTIPVRIAAPAGSIMALQITIGTQDCVRSGPAFVGNTISYQLGFDPDASSDLSASTQAATQITLAATIESDADGDGFGDVTQDACPQLAATSGACPAPDTKKKGKPKLVGGKVQLKFASTIAGSTFQCAIDSNQFRGCKSPLKKKFHLGTHVVRVRAVSPVGVVDPTPVKIRFRLV